MTKRMRMQVFHPDDHTRFRDNAMHTLPGQPTAASVQEHRRNRMLRIAQQLGTSFLEPFPNTRR